MIFCNNCRCHMSYSRYVEATPLWTVRGIEIRAVLPGGQLDDPYAQVPDLCRRCILEAIIDFENEFLAEEAESGVITDLDLQETG